MRPVRNTPFFQLGAVATGVSNDPPAWRRIRRAVDGYAAAIVRILGESYGKDSVQNAWREFTIGAGGRFFGDDPNAELFFSWLFHRWSPRLEEGHKVDDENCYGVPPARVYLARTASGVDPLQRRYLEACLAARLSFYEILDCEPHIGFRARDVLAGGELEVSEGMASTSLKNDDIVFAHIVSIDGISVLEAISPVSFPAILKTQLTELQRHRDWNRNADLPLRRLYFALLESHRRPPLPEFRDAEGDVIDTRILYFDIESPQRAFEALAPLARDAMGLELLEIRKRDADGEVREAALPWLESGYDGTSTFGNVLVGYIHIRGRRMIVEVSSARRAQAFRALISGMPTVAARYRTTRRRSSDQLLQSAPTVRGVQVARH
jgi:hypothetical protein